MLFDHHYVGMGERNYSKKREQRRKSRMIESVAMEWFRDEEKREEREENTTRFT